MYSVLKCTPALVLTALFTGCASHNYDFAATPEDHSRAVRLAEDLNQLPPESQDDEALYDLSVTPLIHSRLHVFAEDDDADTPVQYVEADLESSLPLFAFANGTVSQYDADHQLLTRYEFDSGLWGAFRQHRETVTTTAGVREQTHHTFLWLINWSDDERWQTSETVTP